MLFFSFEATEQIRRGGQDLEPFAKKTCITLKDLNLR